MKAIRASQRICLEHQSNLLRSDRGSRETLHDLLRDDGEDDNNTMMKEGISRMVFFFVIIMKSASNLLPSHSFT
jgi:hypothetical protein